MNVNILGFLHLARSLARSCVVFSIPIIKACVASFGVNLHLLSYYNLQPCNYQLSKSIVHEIKFGDIAVM